MRDLAVIALDAAVAEGATYADARAVAVDAESISVRDQGVEGIEREDSRGVGVRVVADGAWGFAATARLDRAALVATARQAVAVARAAASVRRDAVVLAPTPVRTGTWTTPHVQDPFDVAVADKLELLFAATAAAAEPGGLAFVDASTDAWRTQTWLVTSEGADLHQTVLQVAGGLTCVAIGDGEVQSRSYPNSFRGYCGTGGWEDIVALDLAGQAPGYAEEAVALLSAPDLPAQVGTAVIGGSQLALQTHESVGHPLELDRILGHEADFAGTSFVGVPDLGHLRYGSEHVSFTLDSTTPKALGTFGFDDEGTPAGRFPLVERGVLTGALTSRETAPAVSPEARSNGTMRADSWRCLPLIRMTNIHLEPGEGSLEDLLADTGEGVLLETNSSWSIDDRRHNFQFGCEVAWEITGGRRGRMFRNPTYTGRTTDFWGSCDAVCGPEEWQVYGTATCGKGQPMQVARVAHGAAPARFRNLQMGIAR